MYTTLGGDAGDAASTEAGPALAAVASLRARAAAVAGPKLVVMIPALNEQETIGHVVASVPRHVRGVGLVEVLVLDDGSDDMTRDRALAAGADGIVRHAGNRGLAAAFNHGATEALARGAEIVATLDGDGQHDPTALPDLVAPIVRGVADVVVAARPLSDPSQGSRLRRAGNRAGSAVARRMLGVPLSDVTSGYRAFSREALLQIHVNSAFTYTLDTLVQAAGRRLRMAEIVVPVRERSFGQSRMTRSIPRYVARTGSQAFRTALHANPLRAFGRIAFLLLFAAAIAVSWSALIPRSAAHVPVMIAAGLLGLVALSLVLCGLVADGVSYNRRLLEDALHRVKRIEASDHDPHPPHPVPPTSAPTLVPASAPRPAIVPTGAASAAAGDR